MRKLTKMHYAVLMATLAAGVLSATNTFAASDGSDSSYSDEGAYAAAMDAKMFRTEYKADRTNKQMKSGFASMAAMNGLKPNARACNDTQIAIGAGNYRGTTGVAVGGFHYINNNLMLNLGAGYGGHESTTVSGGITFGW